MDDSLERISCLDDNCIGTINEKGYCNVCGKTSGEIIKLKNDESRLRQIIENLEQSVSKEGAYVKITLYGGGLSETKIVANRNGYLRLGIEFLKAAFAENIIDIDLDYLLKKSTVYIDWFERTEEIPSDL
jgi:hypothetical protein